jgi:hypothetical protein
LGETVPDRRDRYLVQGAGALLAIASNEGDSGALFEEGCCGLDPLRLRLQLLGDLDDVGLVHILLGLTTENAKVAGSTPSPQALSIGIVLYYTDGNCPVRGRMSY